MLPTALGNILRAGELRPLRRYGLDVLIAWPRLWLVLPETARQEISGARTRLDVVGRTMVWALAAGVWSVFVWWAVPVAVLLAISAYRGGVLPAARVYSDLVEAAFDLYRWELYKALRLPMPKGHRKRARGRSAAHELPLGGANDGVVRLRAECQHAEVTLLWRP
ncbi:hypothetical protein [Nonomuraea sp. NPDC050202]|uniref:hypothetical protein n=1 Tax=Nonomuraea sp. NPDC050202 TaxID=3155035 RepID=UPI0033FE7EC6